MYSPVQLVRVHFVAFQGLPQLGTNFIDILPEEADAEIEPGLPNLTPVIMIVRARAEGVRVFFKGWGRVLGSSYWDLPMAAITDGGRLEQLIVVDPSIVYA